MTKDVRAILLAGLALFASVGIAGCGQGADVAQPVQTTKENSAMRSEVPLTRPLSLSKAGEVVNVEFELPPPGPNAYASLMLGLRIARADAESSTALSFKLVESKVAAKVRLIRVQEGAITTVPLIRNLPNLRDRVEVAPDGSVPGLTNSGVDMTMLEEAGLLDPALRYHIMKFATAENVQPGHYRLTIDLDSDHPELENEDVELLVAYFKKAK